MIDQAVFPVRAELWSPKHTSDTSMSPQVVAVWGTDSR